MEAPTRSMQRARRRRRRGQALRSLTWSLVPAAAALAAVGVGLAWRGDGAASQACCVPQGVCFDVQDGSDICDQIGGTLMGPGTSCETVSCLGGCCFVGTNECFDGVSAEDCADAGGTFGGYDTDCEPSPCGLITGRCCLPDGTCIDDVSETNCTASLGGFWAGAGSSCSDGTACCVGDVTADGAVGFPDLLQLLAGFGGCPPPTFDCPADLDGDADVDFDDLILLLSGWSECDG